jgi:hypothetical protein
MYDELIVTNVNNDITDELSVELKSILSLSEHEKEMNLTDDWWLPKDETLLPNFMKSFLNQTKQTTKLNTVYNPVELLEVERLGFGDQKPLDLNELKNIILSEKPTWTYTIDVQSFLIYHTYFSCYCAQVANRKGIPYTPNPSRFPLFLRQLACDFYYPDLRRRLVEEFGEIKRKYLIDISQYFSITKEQLELPLIAGYIWSKRKSIHDSLLYAIDLRHSKEAVAFRKFCYTAEKSRNMGTPYLLI